MTERMTRAYITLQAKKDSGQGALEYIGILAVVAVVIGVVIGAFNGAGTDIGNGVKDLVAKVFTAAPAGGGA